MNTVDRPGQFRARPVQWGLVQSKAPSQSLGVRIQFLLLEWLDDAQRKWLPWEEYGSLCGGTFYIVGRDGSVGESQERNIADLVRFLNWSGDIADLLEGGNFRPVDCQVTIGEEEYNGQTRMKVQWLNSLNGTINRVAPDAAKSLAAKYGSQFRAVAGNVKRNMPLPVPARASTPPPVAAAPPPPARQAAPVGQPVPVGPVGDVLGAALVAPNGEPLGDQQAIDPETGQVVPF